MHGKLACLGIGGKPGRKDTWHPSVKAPLLRKKELKTKAFAGMRCLVISKALKNFSHRVRLALKVGYIVYHGCVAFFS